TKWQLPNTVGVDQVADIEVGVCVPIMLANRVLDEQSTKTAASLHTGSIVQRMRQGVVKIERQRPAKALANRQCAGVISGVSDTAVSRQCAVLWMEEKVGSQHSV